jgi:putative phosphoribosyl transferase
MAALIWQPEYEQIVEIQVDAGRLEGSLIVPTGARGIVLFAHGSGSSRHSSRNKYVVEQLREARLATLLFDLLTREEEQVDLGTGHLRFDIPMLAHRVLIATDWVGSHAATTALPIGYFGASTGAAAALVAAAERPAVTSVVSRGGRPDLAIAALSRVRAATLLIVGERDEPVIEFNREAYAQLGNASARELHIVPDATHLFEEPGALAAVVHLAAPWFIKHMGDGVLPQHEG